MVARDARNRAVWIPGRAPAPDDEPPVPPDPCVLL
jgi:hypothetical protein